MQLLEDKIAGISFNSVRNDIVGFIRDEKELDIWPVDYFSDLVSKIKFI